MLITFAITMPSQAHAATNITVKNYSEMPFYDDAQLAATLTWNNDSKITAFGDCQRCASTWDNPNGDAFDLQKAGNGILLQNVGTDLDGDTYDLKIEALSVKGNHTKYGTVGINVAGENGSLLSAGKTVRLSLQADSEGEATIRFSYLKHGSSRLANVKASPTVYDIDNHNWDSDSPTLLFNGYEGISLADQTATCFVTNSSSMAIDASKGQFYWCGDENGYTGKDLNGAVTSFFESGTFDMTYSAKGAGIDISFDIYEGIDPEKSAVIGDGETSGVKAVEDGTYKIVSCYANNKVWDVIGGSTSNGAKIQTWESNQKWKITTDKYGISTIIDVASGKALDLTDGDTTPGNQLQIWAANEGSKDQQWKIVPWGNGYQICWAKDTSKLVSLKSESTANGNAVVICNSNNSELQKWRFVKVG